MTKDPRGGTFKCFCTRVSVARCPTASCASCLCNTHVKDVLLKVNESGHLNLVSLKMNQLMKSLTILRRRIVHLIQTQCNRIPKQLPILKLQVIRSVTLIRTMFKTVQLSRKLPMKMITFFATGAGPQDNFSYEDDVITLKGLLLILDLFPFS